VTKEEKKKDVPTGVGAKKKKTMPKEKRNNGEKGKGKNWGYFTSLRKGKKKMGKRAGSPPTQLTLSEKGPSN